MDRMINIIFSVIITMIPFAFITAILAVKMGFWAGVIYLGYLLIKTWG